MRIKNRIKFCNKIIPNSNKMNNKNNKKNNKLVNLQKKL